MFMKHASMHHSHYCCFDCTAACTSAHIGIIMDTATTAVSILVGLVGLLVFIPIV